MKLRSPRVRRDEEGVTLVLVLAFLMAIALVVLSLVRATGNDLLSTANLKVQRLTEYAADSATSIAVQSVRYSGAYNAIPPSPPNPTKDCYPGGSPETFDSAKISVFCTLDQYNPISGVTRVMTFYTCAGPLTGGNCSSSNAILQAQVIFDDYDTAAPNNNYFCSTTASSTCGSAMTINSWIFETANH